MVLKRSGSKEEWFLLAEGVNDQDVSHYASDPNGQDDGADGVVGVVWDVHGGERVVRLSDHGHLKAEKRLSANVC